jgi:hypothetical protein
MGKRLLALALTTALGLILANSAVAAPGDKLQELFPADSSFGVTVAFDGEFLYYNNFNEAAIHRIRPDGTGNAVFPLIGPPGINAFSYDSSRNSFWAADSSGLGIWLIPNPAPTAISGTPVTGTLQFTIDPINDRPGDCDNGFFGCLNLIDGLAYDGATDTIWYSPDGSQRIYHYDTTMDTDGSAILVSPPTNGYFDVNDSPNDMVAECGFNYSSGVAAGANDLWLNADGCSRYFQYSKTGTKIASFPYDSTRAEDNECDNITFAPLNAVWVRDVDGRLAAFEQPIECKFGGGVSPPTKARFTGGARLLATNPAGAEPQISVTLHCSTTSNPNRMEVNWKDPATGKEQRFHMTQMTSASCSDDPTITPNPPDASFDTHDGKGNGRLNGVLGATAEWRLQDAGERGTGVDRGNITIKNSSSTTVLQASGVTLDGDWQAHKTK